MQLANILNVCGLSVMPAYKILGKAKYHNLRHRLVTMKESIFRDIVAITHIY